MRGLMDRIKSVTIWGQPLQAEDLRYRHSKRVYIPLFDALVIVLGYVAAVYGVPTIELLFPAGTVVVVSIVLSAAGAAALLGVTFPALWRVEVYGMSLIAGLLAAYALALILRAIFGADGTARAFVALLAVGSLWLPLMRIDVLGTEQRIRRASIAIDREELKARA